MKSHLFCTRKRDASTQMADVRAWTIYWSLHAALAALSCLPAYCRALNCNCNYCTVDHTHTHTHTQCLKNKIGIPLTFHFLLIWKLKSRRRSKGRKRGKRKMRQGRRFLVFQNKIESIPNFCLFQFRGMRFLKESHTLLKFRIVIVYIVLVVED